MAVEDLQECVKEVLCGLSDAILRELQGLIDGQVAMLQAQIAIFQTQLLQYDISSFPIQSLSASAELLIDEVRSKASLIPIPLAQISDCVDLGQFNLNINQSIDQVTSTFDDLAFEATRLLSFREELNSTINELNASIEQFTDIRSVIDGCLIDEIST